MYGTKYAVTKENAKPGKTEHVSFRLYYYLIQQEVDFIAVEKIYKANM